MTAARRAASGARSIGAVLDVLRPDFPDVTISKIRFLESEGLLTPGRTPAGYRQFGTADLERLRFILTAQRDHYLPLRVIREQLDALDAGTGAPALSLAGAHPTPAAGTAPRRRITREELVERTGADESLLGDLLTHGLLRPGPGGFFDPEAVLVVSTAAGLAAHGLGARHLRAMRTAAEREAELLAQVTGPVARQPDPGARGRAEELARELTEMSTTLHTTLVRVALRHEGQERE